MLTMKQALTAAAFHEEHNPGGKVRSWRRNGRTQTWKTRPKEFRIPVKYGLYTYGNIWDYNAHLFHASDDCPDKE